MEMRFDEVGAQITQTRSLSYAVYVDRRNDIFNPTAGTYAIGTLQLAGGPLGGDHYFFKWSAAMHGYRPFLLGGTLAGRVMLKIPYPAGIGLCRARPTDQTASDIDDTTRSIVQKAARHPMA